MAKATYWHNPRCSKSRQGLELLKARKLDLEVVKYLEEPPSQAELRRVIELLKVEPRDLMRRQEKIYKELNLDDPALKKSQLIKIMSDNPILIERPVLICGGRAVIGRPPEHLLKLL